MANPHCSSDDRQQRIEFFQRIEALRKAAMLTVGDMVTLLETSRVTYGKWRNGAKPRPEAAALIDNKVKLLLDLFDGNANHQDKWPTDEARNVSTKRRSELFAKFLATNDDLASSSD